MNLYSKSRPFYTNTEHNFIEDLQSKLNPSRKYFTIQYSCKLCLASGYLNSYNSTYNSNSVHTYILGFGILAFPTEFFFYVNNSYGKWETNRWEVDKFSDNWGHLRIRAAVVHMWPPSSTFITRYKNSWLHCKMSNIK